MRILRVAVISAEDDEDGEPELELGPGIERVSAMDANGEPRFGGLHAVLVRVRSPADEAGLLAVSRAGRDYPTLPLLALIEEDAAAFGTALIRAGADAYHVVGRGDDALEAVLRSLVVRAERQRAEPPPATPVMVLWLDASNVVRRCEGSFVEVLGREIGDLTGRPLNELVPPDMIPMTSLAIGQVRSRQTGPARIQIRAEHTSGRPLRLEGVASLAEEDSLVRVDLRDVTEDWTARQALRESEQRFEMFLRAAPIGIAVVDATGHLALTNEAFERMVGYDAEELQTLSVADLTLPEDLPKDEALFLEMMAGERDAYQIEKRYVRKDGSLMRGQLTVFVQRDEEGRPVTGYGMLEDITETRALEDQLRQAQKLEALGRLAGGVAHDFNNLLTSIRGTASLLLEDLPRESAIRVEAEEILASSERAAHLTRQLLTFSRKAVGSDEVLDPCELIAGMDRMLRRLIPAHIRLETALDPETPVLRLDRSHFEQVIVNLVVNAADAVGDGGSIRVATGRLSNRPVVRITVTDDGVGMDEVVRSRIFEPFFTTKEPGKGTGLGLSTVYGIVARAGGRIEVDSAPGAGTSFHVDLPAVIGAATTPPDAGADREAAGRDSGTVLLVEDNPAVLRLATKVLRRTGFQVLTATDGAEALRHLEGLGDEELDLLLTDAIMPGIRGSELAGAVRESHPRARVLFMSGYDADEVIGREVSDRAAGFLPKPFTPRELREKVREVLAG